MATRIEVLADHPIYLFWAGEGIMNDANAIFYIKRDGRSYFGGTLSVGFLRVQVSNSNLVPNPTVETGEFDTNGQPKQVSVSYTYANNSSGTGSPPSVPSSLNGTITLQRRVAGGAWSQVGTAPITGSGSTTQEGGEWHAEVYASGTLEITDSNSSSGPFEYRATVSGLSSIPLALPNTGSGYQSLTLTSTED